MYILHCRGIWVCSANVLDYILWLFFFIAKHGLYLDLDFFFLILIYIYFLFYDFWWRLSFWAVLCNLAFLVLELFSLVLGITHFVLKVKEIKENESKLNCKSWSKNYVFTKTSGWTIFLSLVSYLIKTMSIYYIFFSYTVFSE